MNMTYEKASKLLEAYRVKPIKIEARDEETKKYNLDNIYAHTLAIYSLDAMQAIQDFTTAEDSDNLEEFKNAICKILKFIDEKMTKAESTDLLSFLKDIFDNMPDNYTPD